MVLYYDEDKIINNEKIDEYLDKIAYLSRPKTEGANAGLSSNDV